jgi:hypothetical protein
LQVATYRQKAVCLNFVCCIAKWYNLFNLHILKHCWNILLIKWKCNIWEQTQLNGSL